MPYHPKTLKGLRMMCLLLVMTFLLPLFPAAVTTPWVVLRKVIGDSDYWDRLNTGWVVEVLGTQTSGDYTWYNVRTNIPVNLNNQFVGYIRGDFLRLMTAEEEAQWLKNPVQGSWQTAPVVPAQPVVTSGTGTGYQPGESAIESQALAEEATTYSTTGYVRITQTNTNLRTKPEGASILQLEKNVILPYYGLETALNAYRWVYVLDTKTNQYGYVRSDCYEFVTQSGTVTSGPALQTPAPATNPTGTTTVNSGYAVNQVEAANLRQTPGGYSVTLVPLNAVVTLTGRESSGW